MTVTNARKLPKLFATTSAATTAVIRGSTVDESDAVLRDLELVADIDAGLAELAEGSRLYTLEDVFGDLDATP